MSLLCCQPDDFSVLCWPAVPQGSGLGSQLFTIFINDLDVGTKCNISKFADDTKLGGNVSCEQDAKRLKADLDRVFLSVSLSICVSLFLSLSLSLLVSASLSLSGNL